ncbi:MAG: hypothetical protein Kow0069_10780 [Promethearchaeota archaeon]
MTLPLGILIIAWRNDVGAYLLDSYPSDVEVDGQDLMQVYNLHRFRSTDPNFQFIKLGADLNLASFYSGGYKSNFVGKPNYCVTLLLEPNENALKFERVLVVATNNLLRHLDDEDFALMMEDLFLKIKAGDFDAIKVERSEGEVIPELDEESEGVGEERELFEDLVAAADELEDEEPDAEAFERASSTSTAADPFGGSQAAPGAAADPFAADPFASGPSGSTPSAAADPFAADPFASGPGAATPGTGPAPPPMMGAAGPSTPVLLRDLKVLDMKKPEQPSGAFSEKERVAYLEKLVDWFEQKLGVLSKIARKLQEKEKEVQEKDELIGKLLTLLS